MITLARSVADVLADHVVFEIECIDRMYCNVYVPQLQHAGGLLGYIQRQLGLPIASTAPLGKITDAFSAAMRRFARDQQVPWVDFIKGQRKDDVMHEYLARFDREEGALFIGRAQDKTSLFRTERRRHTNGEAYPWIVRSTGVVNQFYVYAVDADFGPFFLVVHGEATGNTHWLHSGFGPSSSSSRRAATSTPIATGPSATTKPRASRASPTTSNGARASSRSLARSATPSPWSWHTDWPSTSRAVSAEHCDCLGEWRPWRCSGLTVGASP